MEQYYKDFKTSRKLQGLYADVMLALSKADITALINYYESTAVGMKVFFRMHLFVAYMENIEIQFITSTIKLNNEVVTFAEAEQGMQNFKDMLNTMETIK